MTLYGKRQTRACLSFFFFFIKFLIKLLRKFEKIPTFMTCIRSLISAYEGPTGDCRVKLNFCRSHEKRTSWLISLLTRSLQKVLKNSLQTRKFGYQPSTWSLFSTDREKPGGVYKYSTFRDAQRAHHNRNHSVIFESQKGSFTVSKFMHSTKSIG